MALPSDMEEHKPDFVHYPANELISIEIEGVTVRVIMGEAYGHVSPVTTYAPTLYLECLLPARSKLTLPDTYDELAIYVVSGDCRAGDRSVTDGLMAMACPGNTLRLEAITNSHVMVIGGTSLGKRHIWWNFVSSSKERIEQAKIDWQENRYDAIPGETEFIPLP